MVLECSSQVLEHSHKDMEPSGYTLPPLSEALMVKVEHLIGKCNTRSKTKTKTEDYFFS